MKITPIDIIKDMSESGFVTLPSGATGNSGNSGNFGNATTYSISLSASPAAGGSVGSGQTTATKASGSVQHWRL